MRWLILLNLLCFFTVAAVEASIDRPPMTATGALELIGRVPEIATITYNQDGTSRVVSNFPIQILEGCTNHSLRETAVDMICKSGVRPQIISSM